MYCRARILFLGECIERQRFAQDLDQGAVAGEEHRMFVRVRALAVARLRPASVLPAPGTPVMKQMILRESRFAVSMAWAT